MRNFRRSEISRWLRGQINGVGVRTELLSAEDHQNISPMGWQGDPHAPGTQFIPYAILIPQNITMPTAGMDHPGPIDLDVPYLVTVFGVAVSQVEDICDDIRQAAGALYKADRVKVNNDSWTITRIINTAIGGVGWNNQVSPAMYSETDSYNVSVSRRANG